MSNQTRLRYLFESARLGTMRAASDHLNISTSSISRQLAALEKTLNMQLFEGGRRHIRLTEAGEAACAYYRQTQAQEELFHSRLSELRQLRSGKIDLVVGEAFITDSFSQTLQDFMRAFPGMTVRVRVSDSNTAVARVSDDEAHFGLIFDIPRDPKVTARLSLSQPLKVIVHPKHELASRKILSIAQLSGQRIGMPEDSFRIRQVVRAAEQEENTFLESELVASSMTLLKDFAKGGRGITLLPEFLVHDELVAGRLKAIPTTNPLLNAAKISLITRSARQLPMGAFRLMQRIESQLRGLHSSTDAQPR